MLIRSERVGPGLGKGFTFGGVRAFSSTGASKHTFIGIIIVLEFNEEISVGGLILR